jgi:hypothetical protein
MSTIIYHNHHIIPKYRCKEIGIHPDFEGNVIRLTRKEHAVAHYHRWLKHGRKEDLGATQFLARGEIDGLDTSGKNNGFYGKKHTEEAIEKIRTASLNQSAETRKKISESMKGEKGYWFGKKLSEETCAKMSEAKMGEIHSPERRKKNSEANSGENNPMYGKNHSLETRKKISEAKSGKKHSLETRKKISESQKRRLAK